jgi:BRCA1-associated protein
MYVRLYFRFQRIKYFTRELETSRVWDYQGDGYVHRLIQNKSDGKLVELSGPSDKESAKKLSQDKLDALGLEFSYLLTSSLESQRQFYEDQLAEITAKYTQQHNSMQELEQRYSHLRALHQRLVERCEVETERLQELQSLSIKQSAENKQWQERLRQQQQRIKELEKGWEDEKAVSASLQSTTSLWVGKIKEKDRLIAEKQQMITELQEQVNDLMIFLDSREKIEDLVAAAGSPSEQQSIIEGSVGVAPSEAQAVKNRAAAAASRRKAKKRW